MEFIQHVPNRSPAAIFLGMLTQDDETQVRVLVVDVGFSDSHDVGTDGRTYVDRIENSVKPFWDQLASIAFDTHRGLAKVYGLYVQDDEHGPLPWQVGFHLRADGVTPRKPLQTPVCVVIEEVQPILWEALPPKTVREKFVVDLAHGMQTAFSVPDFSMEINGNKSVRIRVRDGQQEAVWWDWWWASQRMLGSTALDNDPTRYAYMDFCEGCGPRLQNQWTWAMISMHLLTGEQPFSPMIGGRAVRSSDVGKIIGAVSGEHGPSFHKMFSTLDSAVGNSQTLIRVCKEYVLTNKASRKPLAVIMPLLTDDGASGVSGGAAAGGAGGSEGTRGE